ncbi:MAG: DUF5067 domain-containing protein [Clostridia bacterium]|nr:DUF5067 domain-containing protein [Clostridia bacterium]
MKKAFCLVLVLISLLCFASCVSELEWPTGKLGRLIPQIEGAKGEVYYENLNSLHLTIEDINENQYLDYIDDCKRKGFSTDISEDNDSFSAFNSNGYKIELSYYSSLKEISVYVYAPKEMANFDWPDSKIAKLLPQPESNYGKIEWESESGFVIYVGKTTKAEYKNYVNDVKSAGFDIDYRKGDDYYNADNEDGYSVSLRYEGFNTIFIRIDKPDDKDSNSNNNSSSDTTTDDNDNTNSGETDNNSTNNSSASTLGKYKIAIDSYRLSEDYQGEPIIIVKYIFTNNDDDPASFLFSLECDVFQDGIGLNECYFVDDSANYSSDNQTKEIKKGSSIEVEVAYVLNDETTDVEIEVSELISLSDKKISKIFSIE